MKWYKFFVCSLLLSFFAFSAIKAQSTTANKVGTLLAQSNVNGISQIMADNVSLNLNAREQSIAKASALQKLKVFLAEIEPKSYSSKHSGKSENDSEFFTGTLTTKQGTFDVYYLIRNGQLVELCIEE